jgi:hypothetical protein
MSVSTNLAPRPCSTYHKEPCSNADTRLETRIPKPWPARTFETRQNPAFWYPSLHGDPHSEDIVPFSADSHAMPAIFIRTRKCIPYPLSSCQPALGLDLSVLLP